jgi:DNA-binding transcriptional MerR regulator
VQRPEEVGLHVQPHGREVAGDQVGERVAPRVVDQRRYVVGNARRGGDGVGSAGVSVRALRYYEEQQLLAPQRTSGGQRRYADGAVQRVRWIQLLLGAGLPIRTIRELLPCVESGVVTTDVLRRLGEERTRIDKQVTELVTVRDRLDALIATAEQPGLGCVCPRVRLIAPASTPAGLRDLVGPAR